MPGKIQINRGLKSQKKPLSEGELYHSLDTDELFLGKGNGDEITLVPTKNIVLPISHHFMGRGEFKHIFVDDVVLKFVLKVGPGTIEYFVSTTNNENYQSVEAPSVENLVVVPGGGVLKMKCDDATGNTSISIGYSKYLQS